MKDLSKLTVIGIFGLFLFGLCFYSGYSNMGARVLAQTEVKPTPPAEPAAPANTGDKTITKEFTLSTDSLSEYGAAAFNHENHAFQKYSPDGQSVLGCVECHHTDQPKSSLKPPLMTSERDEVLTFDSWKKSTKDVSKCRTCHFQDGNVPEGKVMPTATYTEGDKQVTKNMNNEIAYHINCNNCHDAAFKLRPELKQKKGFSTGKDCLICHVEQ